MTGSPDPFLSIKEIDFLLTESLLPCDEVIDLLPVKILSAICCEILPDSNKELTCAVRSSGEAAVSLRGLSVSHPAMFSNSREFDNLALEFLEINR
ncbi:hypothetical protein [Desulfosporosinus sp. FKB]|uniref:hypothetical protein n=1 Tax=Desulfosporosinus sp. FKB TaxID=1969835 RepID=UPI000B49F800|nr:hypothetical protein [Desulfosporosinus sp. FKB]